MKEETKKWMDKVKEDFRVAKIMFRAKRYGYAAFWCQQAAEKAFKAVQVEREGKFDKVHDLVLLAQKVKAPEELWERCKKLTLAYTYARYPDAPTGKEDMKTISKQFITDCEEVIKWVRKKI